MAKDPITGVERGPGSDRSTGSTREGERLPPQFAQPHPYTDEELATPPSCPPFVGGFGIETQEHKEARQADDPSSTLPVTEFKINKPRAKSHHQHR